MSTEKKADTLEALAFLQKLGVELRDVKLIIPSHMWSKIDSELKKEENKKFKDIILILEDTRVCPIVPSIPVGQF